jgi:hypothetical protein
MVCIDNLVDNCGIKTVATFKGLQTKQPWTFKNSLEHEINT